MVAAKAAVMAVATGEARVAVMEAERVVAMEAERMVAMAVGMAVATGEKTAEVARAVVAGPMRNYCHPCEKVSKKRHT